MKMTAHADSKRFQSEADNYAAYLQTPEGRLRLDLAFANLQGFLPQSKHGLRALDVGCGTGATAIRLAFLGLHVTLLDSSPAMLKIAERSTREAEVGDKVVLQHGDAALAAVVFQSQAFDVILCHNILEYVDDPAAVLSDAAQLMRREPPALLSILVRNRAGEALKAAIQAGDLESAKRSLDAQWGCESLYGGRVRLFTSAEVHAMSKEARLKIIAARGVRVIADYLPSQISKAAEYDRIFKLERELGERPEFAAVARYSHYLARCACPEDVA